jgi:hypothetical protein
MLSNCAYPRHLAAAIFTTVIAVGSPAEAEITKFMRVCGGELCPYFRASVVVPQGWQEDEASSREMNVQIMVPKGRTFGNAGAIIYTTVKFNRDNTPIATLVAEDNANWRKKSRDVKIEHLPDVARATGQEPFLQYRFAMPSRKAQPFERVATTGDVDKDGNTFLVGIVLTATSTKALKVAEPAYLAILNGYK